MNIPSKFVLSLAMMGIVFFSILGLGYAATLTVSTTSDDLVDVGNAVNDCSIREAIVSVNEGKNLFGCAAVGSYGSNDRIIIPAGTYSLSKDSPPQGLSDPRTDNFDIHRSVSIEGTSSEATIIDALVIANEKIVNNGGIFSIGTSEASISVTLKKLTIQNGSAIGFGGGINASFSTNLTIDQVVIKNNKAGNGGGGLYFASSGNLRISDSTIQDNDATNSIGSARGGGLYLIGNTQVINSTLSGNTSDNSGAGIFTEGGTLNLASVTITANTIDANNSNGVGAGIRASGNGVVRLENSLIAGNQDLSLGSVRPDCTGTFFSLGHNLIGDGTGCSGFVATDQVGSSANPVNPRLGPLASNGGPTKTHALLSDSPALDKGAFPNTLACLDKDQRGNPRPTDGNGDAITRCDIGAFEAAGIPPQADLSLTLEASPSTIKAGDVITYTLTVKNNGPATGSSAVIISKLQNATVINPGNCTLQSNTEVKCTLGNLSKDQSITRSFTAVVSSGQTIEAVTNTSEVSSSTADPISSNNKRILKLTLGEASADLDLSITESKDPVAPGESFSYTLKVTNKGPDKSGSIILTGSLTGGASIQSVPSGCTQNSSTSFNCSFAGLAKGEASNRIFSVRAPESPGTIRLNAALSSASADPNAKNNEASQTTQVRAPAADIGVTLLSPTEALTDSDLSLFATVTNLGPDPASKVDIALGFSEPGPARDLRLIGCPFVLDTIDSDGREVCRIENLAVNQTLTLELTFQAPSSAAQLLAFAELSDLDQLDPNSGNDGDQLTININPPQAELILSKEGPSSIQISQDITYRLLINNPSNFEAQNVTLTDTLPSGVSFKTASSGCTHTSGIVRCNLGNLPPASNSSTGVTQREVLITVAAPATPGIITNVADAKADNADLAQASFSTNVTEGVQTGADLSLKKLAVKAAKVGSSFTYTLNLTNFGPEAATDVTLTDTLPAGVLFKEAFGASCSQSGQTINCGLGTLAQNASAEVKLSVTAPDSIGLITNTAILSSTTTDPNLTNNEASASTTITDKTANLALDKTATSVVKVGEDISYTFNLLNLGPDTAEALAVTDILPEGIEVKTLPGNCTLEERTLTCTLASLASGESEAIQFAATAPQQASTITNRAFVSSSSFDSDEGNNSDSAETTILNADGTTGNPLLSFSSSLNTNLTKTAVAGAKDVLVMSVELNSFAEEDVLLETLSLSASGTGNDALDLISIKVLLDSNNNGQIDADDNLLGSGSFSEDNGKLELKLNQPLAIGPDETPALLVAVDIDSSLAGLFIPFVSFAIIGLWVLRRRLGLQVLLLALMLLLTACPSQNGNNNPPPKNTLSYQLSLNGAAAKGLDTNLPADITGLPLNSETLEVSR